MKNAKILTVGFKKRDIRTIKTMLGQEMISGCDDLNKASLEATPKETALFKETLTAMNWFLTSKLGLKPVRMDIGEIHIISRKTMRQFSGGSAAGGVCADNHIYVAKGAIHKLVYRLTHEIVHRFAYRKMTVCNSSEHPLRYRHRQGMALDIRDDGNYYEWLDEATTEMIALNLRGHLIRNSRVMTKRDKRLLESMTHDYTDYTMVMMKLSKRLAAERQVDIGQVLGPLCLDYFTGSTKFLRSIRNGHRSLLPLLKTATIDDLSSIANAL